MKPAQESRVPLYLILLCLFACSIELFSPLTSPTLWRQAQTAILTKNFADSGFSLYGLFIDVIGGDSPLCIFEFPLYNFFAGIAYLCFGNLVVTAKSVTVIVSLAVLYSMLHLVAERYGRRLAIAASFFFILSPVGLMVSSSIQPDALALLYVLLSVRQALVYRSRHAFLDLLKLELLLLVAGLAKFPVVMPYVPLLVLIVLGSGKRLRAPSMQEVLSSTLFCFLPLVIWSRIRSSLNDPVFENMELFYQMFLVGDLSRFLSPNYYIKPMFSLIGYVFCGMGAVFFLLGCRRLAAAEAALLAGIPFYFIIVPTVADQPYYLHAALPIFCFFMGRGVLTLWESRRAFARGLLALHAVFFIPCALYALRTDDVLTQAAATVKAETAERELVFVVNMHDRSTGIGGKNPGMLFLFQRKGWNVIYQGGGVETVLPQFEEKRGEGAEWAVITWYTSDREPWFSELLPKRYRRDPGVDGRRLFEMLRERYPVIRQGKNHALLKLVSGEADREGVFLNNSNGSI